ncbi:MAG: class I SAM-dependent methyltransferase [Rhodobacter sp.]|nr:class I SAM-dependent methyltransferase [Rhodobacter sp.]
MDGSAGTPGELEQFVEKTKAGRPGEGNYRAYVGPPGQYDFMGATQFRLATTLGLREDHSYLDIGCGSLRAGKLVLQYLLPGRYFGIEPNDWLIDEAVASEIGADLFRIKQPRFSQSAEFEVASFGQKFDFIMAQSIFSHTGLEMFRDSIAKIPAVMHDQSQFLFTAVTEHDTGRMPRASGAEGWVYPGCVRFRVREVMRICRESGLFAQALPWFHPRQTWFRAVTKRRFRLSEEQLAQVSGTVMFDPRFK